VQYAFEIAAAIKYADDDNFATYDFECNGGPPLKSDSSQPGADVVTACASGRKIFQRHTRSLNPVDIASGNRGTVSFCNVAIQLEEIGIGQRSKGDLKFHLARFNCRA